VVADSCFAMGVVGFWVIARSLSHPGKRCLVLAER